MNTSLIPDTVEKIVRGQMSGLPPPIELMIASSKEPYFRKEMFRLRLPQRDSAAIFDSDIPSRSHPFSTTTGDYRLRFLASYHPIDYQKTGRSYILYTKSFLDNSPRSDGYAASVLWGLLRRPRRIFLSTIGANPEFIASAVFSASQAGRLVFLLNTEDRTVDTVKYGLEPGALKSALDQPESFLIGIQ